MTSLNKLVDSYFDEVQQPKPDIAATEPETLSYSFDYDERSEPFREVIEAAEAEHGIPKGMLPNLIGIESSFDPTVVSKKDAVGIAQIVPKWHPDVDPTDPNASINYMGKYLKQNYDKFGNWEDAVAAYNMGPTNLKKYGARGLKETAKYLDKLNKFKVNGKPVTKTTNPLALVDDYFDELNAPEVESPIVKAEKRRAKAGTYLDELAGDLQFAGVGSSIPIFGGLSEKKSRRPQSTGEWGPEYGLTASDNDNFITKGIKGIIDFFGSDVELKMSNAAKSQAVVQQGAIDEGVPLHEYRQSPELIEKAASSFVNMATFGTVPAIKEAVTGERDFEATSLLGHAGHALGSLGGLMLGPFAAAKTVVKPVLNIIPRFSREAPVAVRVLTEALADAVVLGPAMGLSQLGEAGKSLTFSQAANHIWEGTKSGAMTGVLFGATRGMFPKEVSQRVARITTGLIGLNAQRAIEVGGNPFTNRPIGEVMFDTLMDIAFLWRGMPKGEFIEFEKTVNELVKEAGDLDTAKQAIQQTPEEATKQTYEKVLAAKKKQFDMKADQLANQVSSDVMIREELARQTEREALEKMRPVQPTGLKKATEAQVRRLFDRLPEGEPDALFESKKGSLYAKVGDSWYDHNGELVTNAFKIKAAEKGKVGTKIGRTIGNKKTGTFIEYTLKGKEFDSPALINIMVKEGKQRTGEGTKLFDKFLSSIEKEGYDTFYNETDITQEGLDFLNKQQRLGKIKEVEVTEPEPDYYIRKYKIIKKTESIDLTPEAAYPPTEPKPIEHPQAKAKAATRAAMSATGKKEVVRTGLLDKPITEAELEAARKAPTVSEPITEVDQQTGRDVPPEGRSATFDETKEVTIAQMKSFAQNQKSIALSFDELLSDQGGSGKSPYTYLKALQNSVNRFKHGDKRVNIDNIRKRLSELAERVNELRNEFPNNINDFVAFKELAIESAKWAREADLADVKKGGGVKLNMMVPLDEVPKMVKNIIDKLKPGTLFKDLWRNKEIFDKTGYWLGQDGKWRYEISDFIDIYDPKNKVRFNWLDLRKNGEGKLSDIYKNEKLYKAVPGIKDITVKVVNNLDATGAYEARTRTIYVKLAPDRVTLMHEIQHAVNEIVGSEFLGTNVKTEKSKLVSGVIKKLKKVTTDPEVIKEINNALEKVRKDTRYTVAEALTDLVRKSYKLNKEDYFKIEKITSEYFRSSASKNYLRDPGEMESRLVEKRMEMSASERKKTPPWETLEFMTEMEGLGYKPGLKLYSGVDPTEMAKQLTKLYDRAKAYGEKSRGMKAFKPKEAAGMVRDELTRAFIDRSGNIRRELLDELGDDGYNIVQAMYLARGSSSMAARALKQMRKEIYSGLSKSSKRLLDDLIFHARMVDIGQYKTEKDFKFFKEHPVEESIAFLGQFGKREGLSAREAQELYHIREDGSIGGKVGTYFEWMKKTVDDMYEGGLITENEQTALKAHNYRRLKLVDVFDHRYKTKVGEKKRTVYDSGVEALSKGRDTDIFERSSEVMALEVLNRAYGRILNNKANLTLLDLARSDKNNPFVKVKESSSDMIPTGWNRIFVYEGGKRKSLYLSPEMSKEWITTNPDMSYRQSQLIRYASGSPVLRTFATGINWGFALANLPRDVMHTWYAARVFEDGKWKPIYNSNAPIFAMQMTRDLAATFLDAVLRRGRYESYIDEGGGMEFLVHQGRLFQRGRHIEGSLDKLYDFMGYFGETSEIMTRLAIRERVLRRRAKQQGKTLKEIRKDKEVAREATFAARDYMDFGQGGWATKAADNAVPYLNAGVVGTRGLWRAFKDNPVSSAWKLTQFAGVVSGAYIAMHKLAPLAAKALQGNIDMQNNLCIPLGDSFSYEDERGQTHYMYWKMPLDPGQKFFKTLFEATTDKWLGNKVDINRVIDSLKEQSPVDVTEMPPSMSGVIGYFTNKDFWLNEDIWRRTEKPYDYPDSKEEYIPGRTPQAYIDFGEMTGLSPERTKYAVEELTTNGTVWSYLMGKGYDAAFGDLPKSQKEQHIAEVLSKMPIVKRFFGVTNPYSQFAGPIKEASSDSSLERFKQTRGLDTLADGFIFSGTVKGEEVMDYIKSFKDAEVFDRLLDRFEFKKVTKDLPNRSFWTRLQGLNTDARARVYVDRLNTSSPEEIEMLREELPTVIEAGGVITPDFELEVAKLRQ